MSETVKKVSVSETKGVNPFFFQPFKEVIYEDKPDPFVLRFSRLEVDKETGSTKPVYEKVNLVEEIQSNKDNCGIEYMKRQLATGQAIPSDFADDGKGSLDVASFPTDPAVARKKADDLSDDLSKLCQELGLDDTDSVTAAKLEKLLAAKVEERWQAELAAKEALKND